MYDTPPAGQFSRGKLCDKTNVIAKIAEGPYGNGRDFPFYRLDGIGWMNEADFINPVEAISFVSPTHGWAIYTVDGNNKTVTYRLYETKDGGDTWSDVTDLKVASGLHLPLSFTDDLHGWMHVGPYNDASVLATEDGGKTWAPVWQSTQPYGNDFESYSFPTATHGWRVVPTHLERTTDGGRTWTELAYPCDAELQYGAHIAMSRETTGWLLCGYNTGPDDFQLFSTKDGGDTWHTVAASGPNGHPNSFGSGGVTGMDFVTDSDGWMSTSGRAAGIGGLFTTSDGGTTWKQIPLKPTTGQLFWNLHSPEFVDQVHGWVIASRSPDREGEIYRTTDGGATWVMLQPPGQVATQ